MPLARVCVVVFLLLLLMGIFAKVEKCARRTSRILNNSVRASNKIVSLSTESVAFGGMRLFLIRTRVARLAVEKCGNKKKQSRGKCENMLDAGGLIIHFVVIVLLRGRMAYWDAYSAQYIMPCPRHLFHWPQNLRLMMA